MNRLSPRIHYSDPFSGTDAVVGVSADQTEVVEDWSDDLFPRASTSSSQSEGSYSSGSRKKGSRTGSVNTRSGNCSGLGSWNCNRGALDRLWEESSLPGSKDDVKLNSTTTFGDDDRGDSFGIQRIFSSGNCKWAEEEDEEGVVIERKREVKGSGDDVELTMPKGNNIVIGT